MFASWDGAGCLTLGRDVDLDVDDHCGQMVLHEICHALIEGPEGWDQVDWGLENIDARHLDRELACHRLQAFWADQVQLRALFAITTDWRLYYDLLPSQAFSPLPDHLLERWSQNWSLKINEARSLDRRALKLAQDGAQRARATQWDVSLRKALNDTKSIASIMKSGASQTERSLSLWSLD